MNAYDESDAPSRRIRHIAIAVIIALIIASTPQWRCTCTAQGRTWPCAVRFNRYGTTWVPAYFCEAA